MLPTTLEAVKSILRADPSVAPPNRARLLALLRSGGPEKPNTAPAMSVPHLLRRREVAARLSMSVRSVDKLCCEGILQKRTLGGRRRASGITSASVDAVIGGKGGDA